jgi:hypothetical protein
MAPWVPKLGIQWRRMMSFTLQPLHKCGKDIRSQRTEERVAVETVRTLWSTNTTGNVA